MSDTKLLQSILEKISSLDRKVGKGFKEVDKKFRKLDMKLTNRLDKLGLQIARLEDDAPTVEEFENLEKRVSKIEKQTASL